MADLYAAGDVCLQPSRLEGLGLQLLECQAAGMPLITTDGPPMSEYVPFRTVRARKSTVRIHREVTASHASPHDLARIMRETLGADVSDASDAARAFGVSRSWEAATERIRALCVG